MILIACVDDNGGLAFNHRRQSTDCIVRERILELTKDGKLWMNHYSFKQFEEYDAGQINASEEFLNEATTGDYCFVEDVRVGDYAQWVERIILFRWNRSYPYDLEFDINLQKSIWSLETKEEFSGNSHEKITMEVYVR